MVKTAILGFGKEGKAVLRFLKERGVKDIVILDRKTDKNYLKRLKEFNVIYRSPGVPYNLREIQEAIKTGVNFSSATDLFFKNARGLVIGVTGTKGKGTTSNLIYKILKGVKKDVYLVGNIGKPAIDILSKLKKNSITVFELSSFQLQDLKRSPKIAVVLEIFPDHMDAHKKFKEYTEAKSSITKYQKREDIVFYTSNNKYAKRISKKSMGKKVPINSRGFSLFSSKDLKIPGKHNFKNAVMAARVAEHLRVSEEAIIKAAKKYRGLPYRLQLIKTLDNVKIYNDSASTNPMTTIAAINSFNKPNILIMGGRDKGLSYKPVIQALKNSPTKLVILFGESRKKIAKSINGARFIFATNLRDAVNKSIKKSKPGEIIIFSPGAASFDMFKDYKDRGKKFNEIVKKLKG